MKWPERTIWKWAMSGLISLVALGAVEGIIWLTTGKNPLLSGAGAATLGVFVLIWAFLLSLAGVRFALRSGWEPFAVARTVLDEAIRMKVAVAFIGLLLLLLPILPFVLSGDQPLRYRLQQFLGFSLGATGFLLSLMTIFLACNTLASEIRDKQIFMISVKPIGRGTYLFGKWLGIITLNAVLVLIAGLAIYGFTLFLAQQPATDSYDRSAVREEVLTAREARIPLAPENLSAEVDRRFERLLAENPQIVEEMGGREQVRNDLIQQELAGWRSVGPRERKVYRFQGLGSAAQYGQYIQFRYRFKASKKVENEMPLGLIVNDRPIPIKAAVDQVQIFPIPTDLIDENGVLEIAVVNINPMNPEMTLDTTITFPPDGLEVLYQVDSFGPNFFRAMVIMWVKLAFLTMLGLAAATFLSFPVAALLALLVYFAASTSGYLLEATSSYSAEGAASIPAALLRMVGFAVAWSLEQYSRFSPSSRIVDGRLVSWGWVGGSLLTIGLIWTGFCAVVGYLIFRGRELAKVQV